jgi:hypothetical protein
MNIGNPVRAAKMAKDNLGPNENSKKYSKTVFEKRNTAAKIPLKMYVEVIFGISFKSNVFSLT